MGPIRLLTFNCWGLRLVSKRRRERLEAIAEKIAAEEAHYDVVALQEVWCHEDWELIDRVCASAFKYRRKFYAGIIAGPGLAVLSKIPIESTFLYRFPINGRPSAFWRGDWFVGKSVAVTLLRPARAGGVPVAVLNSHMHAPYALTGDAAYECHRACQAWDFSKLAKLLKRAGYAVIIVGDLNSRPGSLPHKFLTLETGLVDSWEQLNGPQNLQEIMHMSAIDQIQIAGTTCDSTLNTWRQHRDPTEACRLDYALIDPTRLQTVAANVVFTEKVNGVSFSDHFAYCCELQVLDPTTSTTTSTTQTEPTNTDKEYYNQMLDLLASYERVSHWQQNWRLTHFFLSVLLIIAIHIIVTFTAERASWSSVFWVFAAVAIAVTGTINGLIGYLFVNSELRALQEVRLEVLDSKFAN